MSYIKRINWALVLGILYIVHATATATALDGYPWWLPIQVFIFVAFPFVLGYLACFIHLFDKEE